MAVNKRLLPAVLALLASSLAWAERSYTGIFMNGTRIGYAVAEDFEVTEFDSVRRIDSSTILNAGLLGSAMSVSISAKSWQDAKGATRRMEFTVESAGRTQKTLAIFKEGGKIAVEVDNSGEKTVKDLQVPAGALVVDDAVAAFAFSELTPGKTYTAYVFDPMTTTLVKNSILLAGPAKVTIRGRVFSASQVNITEPRAAMKVYFSSKGDLLKVESPMGMELIPLSEEEALAPLEKPSGNTDFAFSTALKLDKPIEPSKLKRLRLKLTGRDLSLLPNDAHQSTKGKGTSWIVEVHPAAPNPSCTLAQAAGEKADWIKPSLNISSDAAEIIALAKETVGDAQTVEAAAVRIRGKVFQVMRPDSSIGVLRDAREVLKTKEGVCRDYATLACALLRASGVPARLCSGLVYQDGFLYYHAWVEVWEGKNWVGHDPTRNEPVGVGHIKLSQGNVEEAFTFSVLDKVKVEVVRGRS